MTTEAQAEQVQTLLEEGASLYEEGKLYEALASWAEALKIDPDNEIAAEYLRFIEDNFGIGVDAFLSHGDEPAAPPPPPEVPPPPPAPVEQAAAPAAAPVARPGRSPEESVEEMDWSEILEEGGDSAAPVAESEPLMADDEFFVSLDADGPPPGAEAEAWGAAESPAEPPPTKPPSEPPASDPFMMPASQFSEVDPVVDPFGGPGLGEEGVPDTWAVDDLVGDAEPAEMSDDSIDLMLENDFKAWEEATGRRRVQPPTDPFAVEADPYDVDDPGSRPSRAPSLAGGESQPPVVAPPLEDDWTGLPPPLSAPWPQTSQAAEEPRSTRPLGSAPSRLGSQAFEGREVEEDSASIPIPELDEPESGRRSPAADIFGAMDAAEPLLPPVMASFFDDDEPAESGESFSDFGQASLSEDGSGESPDFVPGLEPLDEAALDFPSLDLLDAGFSAEEFPSDAFPSDDFPAQEPPPPPPPPVQRAPDAAGPGEAGAAAPAAPPPRRPRLPRKRTSWRAR
ncbi:MAG: hypothetical protein H6706_17870 [Myxococcales bacterium]|nr:hypothetical protein [Myxococcales bacterium]